MESEVRVQFHGADGFHAVERAVLEDDAALSVRGDLASGERAGEVPHAAEVHTVGIGDAERVSPLQSVRRGGALPGVGSPTGQEDVPDLAPWRSSMPVRAGHVLSGGAAFGLAS